MRPGLSPSFSLHPVCRFVTGVRGLAVSGGTTWPGSEGGGGGGHASASIRECGTQPPFASIIPFLSGLPGTSTSQDKEAKPARFLVVKGLPTLPMKLVEKAWNMEFVEMEDFLPAPRSLRIAEQGKPSSTLQESLVGGGT